MEFPMSTQEVVSTIRATVAASFLPETVGRELDIKSPEMN
jgi:hypothetical protein